MRSRSQPQPAQRDALLKQISSIIGVTTMTRDNNHMALYTSDGTTLFETTARSTNMTSRISTSETVTSSTNANSEGMRYLALAATVISAIGSQDISADALSAVTSSAMHRRPARHWSPNRASSGCRKSASKRPDALDAQSSLLTTRLTELQGVDTYEASTLINTLQTQLETAYTLVSKLQSLSLVDYL